MKTTIIFAHPWHGSFNKGIFDAIKQRLVDTKREYQVIDLNKDEFDPVLNEKDLKLFSKGQSADEQVTKYQDMITNSDELIFVFPIWWSGMPAILKGFIDKVMLKDFAYEETKTGLKGLLTHIKKTTIVTTSEFPNWYLRLLSGNPIAGTLMKAVFKSIGLKKVTWLNNDFTSTGTVSKRGRFINKVIKSV